MIAAATVLALGLRIYQLSLPGYLFGLTEYDDGSYFGSAVHLTQGILPYRDFVFVQPPGIILVMLPAALLAKVAGTAAGMAAGRILTAVASAAGVVLLGLLVRHRGALATLIACGVLAIFPDSIAAARTLLVEPWLVLFCLTGAVAVLDRDRLTGSRRRLIWGGAAFGFAGVVEAWAILPALVLLALMLPWSGRAVARTGALIPRLRPALAYAGGMAAGFLVPALPFLALAPSGFYRGLVTAQVGHRSGTQRVPDFLRLREMTGLSHIRLPGYADLGFTRLYLHSHSTTAITAALLALLTVGALIVLSVTLHQWPSPLEWFAVVTGLLVVAAFLYPDQFAYHFSAFLAPFLGLAIALPFSRSLPPGSLTGRVPRRRATRLRWPRRVAGGVATVILAICAIFQVRAEGQEKPLVWPRDIAEIHRLIPPGACTTSDEVSMLILAGRFLTHVPGCSAMVDGTGTDLALSGGLKPETGAGKVPAVAAQWWQAFGHAGYVWLSVYNSRRVAWTPALHHYFATHFAPVQRDRRGDVLYRRILP